MDENQISSQYISKDMSPPVAIITPDIVRPYPRAKSKICSRKGNVQGKSRLFTDTYTRKRKAERIK